MLLDIEKLEIVSKLLRAITTLETELTIFIYFRDDFLKKWPEMRQILSAETVSEQIDIVLAYPEILNSEENGELETIKALISSYLRKTPSAADIDLFKKQIRSIQNKLFRRFMDLVIV
jgi:hypothetical protein